EVVIAPDFDAEALDILSASKNVRLLRCAPPSAAPVEIRPITGGILMQSVDRVDEPGDDPANWQLKAGPAASQAQLADLAFAWKACRSVKSNAILLAARSLGRGGHGPGQPGGLGAPGRAAGRGPGGGLGRGQRRLLPVRRRLRDPGPGRGGRG